MSPRRVPSNPAARQSPAGDGTRQLLQWGGSMVGTGLVAAVLMETVWGGFTRTGATTNPGWLALIVALMCIPFGAMLLTLGLAKWFRNRSIQKPGRRRGARLG
ncbi:MAG TPA: hypothetical protein VMU48_06115 [Terracidiphilus sp.]|nr:hypothetical protein [Terracidiphilus sp.]